MGKERPSYDDRPERSGRKGVTTYLLEAVARRLKMISVETDTTIQQITEAAVMEWIDRYEKKAASRVIALSAPAHHTPLGSPHLQSLPIPSPDTAHLSTDRRLSPKQDPALAGMMVGTMSAPAKTAKGSPSSRPSKPATKSQKSPLNAVGQKVRPSRASKS